MENRFELGLKFSGLDQEKISLLYLIFIRDVKDIDISDMSLSKNVLRHVCLRLV